MRQQHPKRSTPQTAARSGPRTTGAARPRLQLRRGLAGAALPLPVLHPSVWLRCPVRSGCSRTQPSHLPSASGAGQRSRPFLRGAFWRQQALTEVIPGEKGSKGGREIISQAAGSVPRAPALAQNAQHGPPSRTRRVLCPARRTARGDGATATRCDTAPSGRTAGRTEAGTAGRSPADRRCLPRRAPARVPERAAGRSTLLPSGTGLPPPQRPPAQPSAPPPPARAPARPEGPQ